jgi:hypothetical protein
VTVDDSITAALEIHSLGWRVCRTGLDVDESQFVSINI